jgi:hypothetical protein
MSRYNRLRNLIWHAFSRASDTALQVPPRVQAARQILPSVAPAMAASLLDRRAIRLRRD